MENGDKYQALDNLEQLLHHYSDALVTKETADGLEVGRADKVSVRAVYVGVGNVQRLRREEETREDVLGTEGRRVLRKVCPISKHQWPHTLDPYR